MSYVDSNEVVFFEVGIIWMTCVTWGNVLETTCYGLFGVLQLAPVEVVLNLTLQSKGCPKLKGQRIVKGHFVWQIFTVHCSKTKGSDTLPMMQEFVDSLLCCFHMAFQGKMPQTHFWKINVHFLMVIDSSKKRLRCIGNFPSFDFVTMAPLWKDVSKQERSKSTAVLARWHAECWRKHLDVDLSAQGAFGKRSPDVTGGKDRAGHSTFWGSKVGLSDSFFGGDGRHEVL